MKNLHLTPLGPNVNEVRIGDVYVLFSYQEAVAYRTPDGKAHVTAKRWSSTTTRHVTKWVGDSDYDVVTQESINKLVASGGANEREDIPPATKEVADGEAS